MQWSKKGKIMKKVIITILAITLLVAPLHFEMIQSDKVHAQEPKIEGETTDQEGYYKKDNYIYKIENGKAVVYGQITPEDVVTVPENINGYEVTKISPGGFITSRVLNIPKTVKSIFGYVSPGNSERYRLEEINVDKDNKNFTSIGGVLYNKDISRMLIYPTLRKAKKYIEPSTVIAGYYDASRDYSYSRYLEDITFSSNNNTHIIGYMYNCPSLKTINIPANIRTTSPGDKEQGSCEACVNLENVNFAKNSKVENISKYTFWGCTRLKKINIPKSVKKISGAAFFNCSSLSKVTLHKGLKTIGDTAFCNCIKLKTIKIPKTVTSIGMNAFERCKKLKTVKLKKGLKTIKGYAFYKCKSLKKITLPKGLKEIGKYAFRKTKIKKVKIPKSVKKLTKKAFNKGCKIKKK